MASDVPCANCGAPMSGEFCAACGQRRFRPQDRRLKHLLGETFGALTDLDGRFWRSLRALMLRPGRIARDWIDGRRAYWISPIRLFLLVNLLYFITPALTDLTLPLHVQVRGSAYSQFTPGLCEAKAWKCRGGQYHSAYTEPVFLDSVKQARAAAAAHGEAFVPAEFEQRYNARSAAIGKLLVIVHVPFIAAMLALVAWQRRRYYAEHFVVALGMFTFVLLFAQVVIYPLGWLYAAVRQVGLPGGDLSGVVQATTIAVVIAHFVVACRRCYDSRWPAALLQGTLAFLALGVASIFVYRPVQFVLALWTM